MTEADYAQLAPVIFAFVAGCAAYLWARRLSAKTRAIIERERAAREDAVSKG